MEDRIEYYWGVVLEGDSSLDSLALDLIRETERIHPWDVLVIDSSSTGRAKSLWHRLLALFKKTP